MRSPCIPPRSILLLPCALVAAACSDPASPGDGGGGGGGVTVGVNEYLAALPAWAQYSPAGPVQDSVPDGRPDTSTVVVANVEQIGAGGAIDTLTNVAYVCVTDTVSWSNNPEDLVMYNPSADILYPGGLIQGKSYKQGGLEGLPISERAPLRVSIPALATGNNFRVVENPNESTVGSAVGEMIGDATDADLEVGATTVFKMETFHSEEAFAMSMNASGRYFGFRARVGGSFSRAVTETTVTVHYAQKMFDVVVGQPQTPSAFFSDAFTQARLNEQVAQGNIGPDNPPVYVAVASYGRMMAFSLTSTASEQEIKGTLQASYNAVGSGGSVSLDAKQQEILRRATIKITSLGGNDSATIAMIRSGDWRAYFTQTAKLSTARPLSYTFKSLDGVTAKVWEATRYPVRTCQPRAGIPGPFEFLESQDIGVPIAAPYTTHLADVDGDGTGDLVFNHLSANVNDIAIARGTGTGAFAAPVAIAHGQPVPSPEGWTRYSLQTGDIDGDGRDDLVWHNLDDPWRVYTALGTAGGSLTFPDRTQHYENLGPAYRLFLADLDGDGAKDLFWNELNNTTGNRYFIGMSMRDGRFDVDSYRATTRSGQWAAWNTHIADLNGDGRDDIIWNLKTNPNRISTAITRSDTLAWTYPGTQTHPTACCWDTYQPLLGDFNGDNNVDLWWANSFRSGSTYHNGVHGAMGLGTGSFRYKAHQNLPTDSAGNPGRGPFRVFASDIDGDGITDLVWNRLDGSGNRVAVVRGVRGSDMLDVSDVAQQHPDAANWLQAAPLLGDVNRDGRGDIVWIIPGGTARLFVALGKVPNT